MTGDWIFLTALWLCTVVVVVFGARPISDKRLARWHERFAVHQSDATDGLVRSRLRQGATVRWLSFAVGANITALPMYMNVIDPTRAADFNNPAVTNAFFVASATGAALFELIVRQRPHGGEASLVRRQPSDYIDLRWRTMTLLFTLAAIAATSIATARAVDDWRFAWIGAVWALVGCLVLELGLRQIIHRPAMVASGQERDIDEALRSDGIHHVVGSALALAVVGASVALTLTFNRWPWVLAFSWLPWLAIAWWARLWYAEPWSVSRRRRATA